jgi:quinol monooxygenase YgiN
MLFLHLKPGRRHDLLRVVERLEVLAVASRQQGFLGVELAVPVDDEDRAVIVGSWASPEHYERWLAGPLSGQLLDQIEELLSEPPESHVYRVAESVS